MRTTSPSPLGAPAARAPRGARVVAGVLCGLQALVLVGVAAFYLYELVLGEGSDGTRVVMSALVILLAAVGLAVLSRGWLRWTRWPRTPTVLWDLLLLPVVWGLLQAGRAALGGLVLAVALVAVGAALVAPRPEDPDVAGAPSPGAPSPGATPEP
ncbi:hypothetical protein [Phycicoccus duodecadis]|nr:hypothetical protein [Phycicoccus duodecadis]